MPGLRDSLIEYWPLNESSGSRTGLHTGIVLTDNNTVPSGTGLVYSIAADFERGDAEWLSVADRADLSTGDIDFTAAAWVKIENKLGAGNYMTAVSKQGDSEFEWNVFHDGDVDRFVMSAAGSAFPQVVANNFGAPSTDTWYLIFCWHDAAGNSLNIQVNTGTPNSNTVGSPDLNITDTGAPFGIGSRGSGGAHFWDGLIGPVMFWKRVLTSDERTQLYNGGAGLTYDQFGRTFVLNRV